MASTFGLLIFLAVAGVLLCFPQIKIDPAIRWLIIFVIAVVVIVWFVSIPVIHDAITSVESNQMRSIGTDLPVVSIGTELEVIRG